MWAYCASTGSTLNFYINSCTLVGNSWLDSGSYGQIASYQTAGTINMYVFNTISMLSVYRGDFNTYSGTANWSIRYSIDSDGSIDTEDTGAVGCLTNMNATSDYDKGSDGDWIIFWDVIHRPFDLRLIINSYNEAYNAHTVSEHTTDIQQLPGKSIDGVARYVS